jgi:hypothetical protein
VLPLSTAEALVYFSISKQRRRLGQTTIRRDQQCVLHPNITGDVVVTWFRPIRPIGNQVSSKQPQWRVFLQGQEDDVDHDDDGHHNEPDGDDKTKAATTTTLQSTAGDNLGGGYERIGWVGGMKRQRWIEFFCEGNEDDVDHNDGHDGADGRDDDGCDNDYITINWWWQLGWEDMRKGRVWGVERRRWAEFFQGWWGQRRPRRRWPWWSELRRHNGRDDNDRDEHCDDTGVEYKNNDGDNNDGVTMKTITLAGTRMKQQSTTTRQWQWPQWTGRRRRQRWPRRRQHNNQMLVTILGGGCERKGRVGGVEQQWWVSEKAIWWSFLTSTKSIPEA